MARFAQHGRFPNKMQSAEADKRCLQSIIVNEVLINVMSAVQLSTSNTPSPLRHIRKYLKDSNSHP